MSPLLEAPQLPEEQLAAWLRSVYHLPIIDVTFLPLGADPNSAVYRAEAADGSAYFLKLRRGVVPEATIALPAWLAQHGNTHVIAPLATADTGALSTSLPPFTAILFPFITGQSAWDRRLSPQQWCDLGMTLQQLHHAILPEALVSTIPVEDYSPRAREQLAGYLQLIETRQFDDPAAQQLAVLLQANRATIAHMLTRAQQLAEQLAAQPLELCLCHGDIHAWNVLVDRDDHLFVIDWDTLVFAPKEHDLMFVDGGVGRIWNSADEHAWFYQGYGPAALNLAALTYYRYERIVQDFAVTGALLFETPEGGEDRQLGIEQLTSQFAPDDVIDIAYRTDAQLQASTNRNV